METVRNFLDISSIEAEQVRGMVASAIERKRRRADKKNGACDYDRPLEDCALALMFEKSSTRTRYSFLMAMHQLGGRAFVADMSGMQLSRGESVKDTAQVISRYVDIVMLRAASDELLRDLAHFSSIPVINGLSPSSHPCQVLADVQTIIEHRGSIEGKKIAWFGSCGNVCASWIEAAAIFDFDLVCACPANFSPAEDVLRRARSAGGRITVTDNVAEAADDASVIVTDTWHSMNDDEAAHEQRVRELSQFMVTEQVMAMARHDALFTHCMPAYRGQEVTAEVLDGESSVVLDAAENRIHAQKAILLWCLRRN